MGTLELDIQAKSTRTMTRWPRHLGYYCRLKMHGMCKQGMARCSCACHEDGKKR